MPLRRSAPVLASRSSAASRCSAGPSSARLFERRAADYINPDVCNCGGILELTEIAAWAEAHPVLVTPHNWNSLAVGLAATLQAAACVRDLLYVEHISAWTERSADLLTDPAALEVVDGTIAIPTAPGLGIDLDEAALAPLSAARVQPPLARLTGWRKLSAVRSDSRSSPGPPGRRPASASSMKPMSVHAAPNTSQPAAAGSGATAGRTWAIPATISRPPSNRSPARRSTAPRRSDPRAAATVAMLTDVT